MVEMVDERWTREGGAGCGSGEDRMRVEYFGDGSA